MRTLRFAWHLTTIAWWGFATILVLLANPQVSARSIAVVIGVTFLIHGIIALAASRGKHLSWIVFLMIGLLAIFASRL